MPPAATASAPSHSKNAWPKGGNGWKGYHYENAELDAALDAVGTEFDPAKRTPLLQQVCKIDAESSPTSTCGRRPDTGSSTTGSRNFVSTPGPGMGNYYKAAETWFVQRLAISVTVSQSERREGRGHRLRPFIRNPARSER